MLSKTKPTSTRRKKGRLGPQERFQREWERVQTMQKQNERLKRDVEGFAERVIPLLEPVEERFAQVQYDLAELLLSFAAKKSLAQWQREELFSWIDQLLSKLAGHPFAGELDVAGLVEQLDRHVGDYLLVKAKRAGLIDDELGEGDEQEAEDALNDMFTEFLEHEGIDFGEDEGFSDDSLGGESEQQEASLSLLLKSSSINKMFRQIASAVHPDREKDATLRLQRNQLMAELARARDDKDITKIFAMYAEHVGASPLEFIGEDIEKVITLLKRQVERLRSEKQEILYANPFYGSIYEAFYDKSQTKVAKALQRYFDDLEERTFAHQQMTWDISSLKTLKLWLEQRAAYNEQVASMIDMADGRQAYDF